MKVGVYLSTLMVFSAVLGEQPQKKKAPSKKKGKPGGMITNPRRIQIVSAL